MTFVSFIAYSLPYYDFSPKGELIIFEDKKSHIRETKHLLTDADSSTDTTVGWTKNTRKPKKLKNGKIHPKRKNSK